MGAMNFGGGGFLVGFGLWRRLLRGSDGEMPVRPEEVQTAEFSVAIRSIGRAVRAERPRRLAAIGFALPLVLVRSHLILPFSSAWRSKVHSPRSFLPVRKMTRRPFQ